jgi:general secretion pathway protein K
MNGFKDNRGMALLVVLVVVALLTALVTDLAFSTLVDMRLTETFRDTTRAYYLAKGGINAGRMILQMDRNNYDGLNELWSQGVNNFPVGDAFVTVNITDMDGKLGINALVTGDSPNALMVSRFYRLFVVLGFESQIAADLTANLIDWLDTGNAPCTAIHPEGSTIATAGAESNYYQELPQPYPIKNGPLDTLDELALVKGFTPDVLRRVLPYVGLHDTTAVNINTASAPVLMSLDPSIDDSVAETLIKYRKQTPITSLQQLQTVLPQGPYSALKSQADLEELGVTSNRYLIVADVMVNDGRRRLEADVAKQGNKLLFFKVN